MGQARTWDAGGGTWDVVVRGAGDEEPEKFMTDRSFIRPASSSNRTVYRCNADRYIHTHIHAINLQHTQEHSLLATPHWSRSPDAAIEKDIQTDRGSGESSRERVRRKAKKNKIDPDHPDRPSFPSYPSSPLYPTPLPPRGRLTTRGLTPTSHRPVVIFSFLFTPCFVIVCPSSVLGQCSIDPTRQLLLAD